MSAQACFPTDYIEPVCRPPSEACQAIEQPEQAGLRPARMCGL